MKHNYNIDDRIKKFDKEIDYISGYEDCKSIVKCYCNRCNNYFERKWCNLARRNTEYCCPICQTKLGMIKSNKNRNTYIKPTEDREKQFIKRLLQKNNQLTYIGGYIHSEKSVLLECNVCGYRFKRNANGIRGKKNYTCPNCQEKEINKQEKEKSIEKEINKMLKQQSKLIIDLKKQRENNRKKEINKINRHFNNKTLYIKSCLCCGEEYIEHTKSIYCSKCRNRKRNNKHSYKSLKQLYKRDEGICYICGNKCDYEDYIYKGNTFIAGNYYPSIDHVIPLTKGGTDDWNNLKLAHRLCNSLKGSKSLIPPRG